jgi:protein-S-isoprenylcysteine O-methyltransferase Ste14
VLAIRSGLWALIVPGLVLAGAPAAILNTTDSRFGLGEARWVGLALVAVGASGLLWCIVDFAKLGEGTLSPVDAPRLVVRGGLYRYVRNPMYLSVLTVLVGEVLFFRSLWLLLYAAAFTAWFNLVVLTYEEPGLVRQFGESYEGYRRSVPRWRPRRPRT